MTEVKRYAFEWTTEGILRVQESTYGQYVKYEDLERVVLLYENILKDKEIECLKKKLVS